MNFVEPKVELYSESDPLLKLERCIRVAYKSESKISEGSAEKLIKTILSHHHTSTLEHYRIKIMCTNKIADSIARYNERSGRAHIRILDHEKEEYPMLVGNLRAFLDLTDSQDCDIDTRWIIQDLLYSEFPRIFPEVTEYPANFDSLDFDSVEYLGEANDYATFHVVTDRGVLAEITRHRSLSFTVESTRFCDYQKNGVTICQSYPFKWSPTKDESLEDWVDNIIFDWAKHEPNFITPDGIITHTGMYELARLAKIQGVFESAMKMSESAYYSIKDLKEKPQSARSVLPNALKTEMYVTGTYDAWDHFLKLRCAEDAHPQIRVIANKIKELLKFKKGDKDGADNTL